MTTIRLLAEDLRLRIVSPISKVTSGNQNAVELKVDFTSHWANVNHRTAVFFTEEDPTVYEVFLTDGKCTVPWEVLENTGDMMIGVRGVNAEDQKIKPTTLVKYRIEKGAPAGDGTVVEPTPDVYQQILAKLDQLQIEGGGVSSVNGKTGSVTLTAQDVGALTEDAVTDVLARAKESGEFDGPPGKDYVLTEGDKEEIADKVKIPTGEPLVVNLSEDGTTDKNIIDMSVAWMENRQVLVSLGDAAIALTGLRGESAFFSGVVNGKEVAVVVTGNTYEITETDLATEQYVKDYAQPKGDYLTAVPDGYAKTEDIPTKPEDIGAQPVGDYLTEVPEGYATEQFVRDGYQPKGNYLTEHQSLDGYATEEFVKNKIAEAELGGEEVDLSGYAQKSELPTKVSQLENDKGYLTQHQDISGKLDASALPTAINTALAQAKTSGEFDGKDGVDGQPGKDGYTPQKNVDYFDGQPGKDGVDGAPGTPGADGITPHIGSNGNWYIGDTDTGKPSRGASGQPGQNGSPGADGIPGEDGVSATHSWNGTVLTVTSASGTSSADLKGAKGDKGDSIKGDPGADGVSPTVAVSKSGKVTTVSITDKNGTKTATINDGSDGSNGKDGTSVTVKSVSESTADGGSNVVTFSDGKTVTIKNGSKGSKGDTGSTGATGQRGTGLLAVTTAPSSYTTAVGGITPKYRMAISTLKTQAGVTEVLLGDTVRYSYYIYPIAYLDASYAYFTTRVSIRGATGTTPVKGTDYFTDADKEEFLNDVDAVRYVEQTLTEEQKAQVRQNIGVAGNKWAGKIASFLGDSITRGMNTDKTYHEYLQELVGFSACNAYGISGSTVSNYYESMCNRVSDIDAQSDIVFAFGGTNDFNLSIPMGEWYTLDGTTRTVNYDKTTFRGALTTLCNALLNRFPNKRIVLLTPLHRYTYPDDYTELQANAKGLYLEDYVNAVKEAGKIYSIPVIDLYGESGLCPMNAANAAIYFHANDKLHPNAAGHRVIADVIMGYLDRTYPMYSVPVNYTNLVPSAEERIISGDALTAYDGVGYANNYRLSSSGVIKKQDIAIATGFIPVSGGDTIRIGGIQWCVTGVSYNYVCAYKSDYSFIGAVYGSEAGYYGTKIHTSCTIDYDAPLTTIELTNNTDIAFIRISCFNQSLQDGSKLIVTVNEEITT